MTRTIDNRIGIMTFIIALLLLAAGCQTDPTGGFGDEVFPGETGQRSVNQFADAQAASAARQDATLRDIHFDRNQLNSLGREKLEMMLEDDDALPLVLWMDADDQAVAPRSESVAAFLTDKGLEASQFEFKNGENPDNYTPIAPHLARMSKTESTGDGAMDAGTGFAEGDMTGTSDQAAE